MNVNKQTIITLLLTLVAIAGRAQAFQYRIVGNIGIEFTGWLYLMNQSDKDYSDVDSLWVEDGVIRTFEGNAQEPRRRYGAIPLSFCGRRHHQTPSSSNDNKRRCFYGYSTQ